MKKPQNWDKVQATIERKPIAAGGYLCKIYDAKVLTFKEGEPGEFKRLDISVDIIDGEFKDYYKNDYKMQQNEDKRWRGVIRQYVPKDDGTDMDEWTKSNFKAMTNAVEDSNPNYHWDWDENSLKDKFIGCLFRNEEWEYNGKNGWKVQPFKLVSSELIKSGEFQIPKDKPLKNSVSTNTYTEVEDDGDLPF